MKTRSLATVAVVLLIVVVGIALLYAVRSQVPATAVSSTAPASPAASPSNSPSPSASPALAPGTFENWILGYRITLPVGYRRSFSRIFTGQETLGVDLYTLATEAQEREGCLHDLGDIPSPPDDRGADIRIGVISNVRGVSALEWATASPLSTHQKLEQATIGGREAVRFVADNASAETNGFVIRANDRIYELYPTQGPPPTKTWLDEIAKTFVAIQPAAFPTPAATTAPRVAAGEVAEALRKAFAARDADAVAGLMSPCHIGVSSVVEPVQLGSGGCCIINRSVSSFIQALRDRFARGDLSVTLDPAVQTKVDLGGEHYFVRSEWRETDRTTPIDLFLREIDGRWVWGEALHHYQRADALNGCIPYRSPWTASPC